MNFKVDYDRLVDEVLGDSVQFARNTLKCLALHEEYERVRSVLHNHAGRYMEAKSENELYAPFRDFAEELFRFAELPYQFIDTHGRATPNDSPDNGDPRRKSVILCTSVKLY